MQAKGNKEGTLSNGNFGGHLQMNIKDMEIKFAIKDQSKKTEKIKKGD